MEALYPLIAFVIGGALGAAIVWRVLKEKTVYAEQKLAEAEAELKRALEEAGALKVEFGKLEERCAQVDALAAQLEGARSEAGTYREAASGLQASLEAAQKQLAEQQALGETQAAQLDGLRQESGAYREKAGRLESELASAKQQIAEERALLEDAQQKLKDVFKAVGADALKDAQTQFFEVAEQVLSKHTTAVEADLEKRQQAIDGMVKPLKESLEKVDKQVQELDKEQLARTEQTKAQVEQLISGLQIQQKTTHDLRSILRGPTTRGRAGETFLKRVLELAGLEEKLHFDMQVSETVEGARTRPDCIVHLPGGKGLIIDAKTPLNAYEDSVNLEDDAARAAKLREHARNLRGEIDRLARRPYTGLSIEAEFVVMYLPIEASFSAALLQDPEIVNCGWDKNVLLSGPTTLFALLKNVVLNWRQDSLQKNAQEIRDVGREMVERVRTVAECMTKLGRDLDSATKAYNKTVNSMESRLIVTARRFQKLGVGQGGRLPTPLPIATEAGEFSKPDLRAALAPEDVAALEARDRALGLFEEDDLEAPCAEDADAEGAEVQP